MAASAVPGRRKRRSRRTGQPSRWRPRVLCLLVGGSVLGGGLLGCSGDTPSSPALRSATHLYWVLQLSQHAVNLALTAPDDTVQLTATALNADGTPLAGVDSVVHYSGIDSTVTVSATGLVTAHYVTSQTQVIASLTTQGVTHTDTVFLQVTPTPLSPSLATFSLQPAAGDSAKRSYDIAQYGLGWPVIATNTAGDTVCNASGCVLQVDYTSSNPLIATIDRNTGYVTAHDTGQVVLTVTTLAYGVPKRDSVVFTVGYILKYTNSIMPASIAGRSGVGFSAPPTLIMGVGAVVSFNNEIIAHPVDVVFDDTVGVDTASSDGVIGNSIIPPTGSGDIAPFGGDTTCPSVIVINYGGCAGAPYYLYDIDNFAVRRFRRPGIYHYHSTLFPSDTFELIIQAQQ